MSADPVIFHHYEQSPYSEKVRKIFGYKQMAWRSVQIPPTLPRPDTLPLTGGYRKTPVLQVGRDIYCDTKLICRVLDRLQPTPPLIPAGQEATAMMVERWVDQTLFFHTVAVFFQPAGLGALAESLGPGGLDQFLKDRAAMFAQGGTQPGPKLETARAELPPILTSIEAQLAGRPFLGGSAPTQIDFAVYCPIWFTYANNGTKSELARYPRIRAWADRMLSLGEGTRTELSGAAAIDVCRATTTSEAPLPGPALELPQAKVGDTVKIGAVDYAPDAVQGVLTIANAFELAVKREDPRAGTVVVHFPAEGFSVTPAA